VQVSWVEFVFSPICRIGFYIIIDALIFGIIPDNMVVETGLPAKIEPQAPGVFGYGRFVRPYNGRNGVFARILKTGMNGD